jgi:hypothetical protein
MNAKETSARKYMSEQESRTGSVQKQCWWNDGPNNVYTVCINVKTEK